MNFPKPENNIDTVTLSPEYILELYNSQMCSKREQKEINSNVILWVTNFGELYGWEVIWNGTDNCTLKKLKAQTVLANNLEELLASAFTKVAHHACRQGENNTRFWPPLSNLKNPESWKTIGVQYAKEFAVQLLELYLSKGIFVEDINKLAGR